MEIQIKLDAFEGPLDLLLHLIDINKMNIFDIQIVTITEQYLEYMEQIDSENMDIMSEFLVMAAQLLKIKSQMLLPKEEKKDTNEESEFEDDPRAELVRRLLEYKMYKYAAMELKDKQVDADRLLFKEKNIPEEIKDYKEEINVDELIGDLTLAKLQEIFSEVLKRREDKIDPIRSKFGKIEKEEVNLSDKIRSLQEYGLSHRKFSFKDFLEKQPAKMDVIVSFLGILELMKIGRISIIQDNLFDDIIIEYLADDTEPVFEYSYD